MSNLKNKDWREKLKNKPIKYWVRDEIEAIVKEKNIDRNRFGEFSKLKYDEIIKRFYYTYADYENHPKIELSYCWLHFRDSLSVEKRIYENEDWISFLHQVGEVIEYEEDKKYFMILSQGWVYEGYAKEIVDILEEVDGLVEDFYIISPAFDWMVAYCDDGRCAVLYRA